MRGGGGLDEAQPLEDGVVCGELYPCLEFQRGQAEGAGAGFGAAEKGAAMAFALMRRVHSEFADIEGIGPWGEEDAGDGGVADHPDLSAAGLISDGCRRQAVE